MKTYIYYILSVQKIIFAYISFILINEYIEGKIKNRTIIIQLLNL